MGVCECECASKDPFVYLYSVVSMCVCGVYAGICVHICVKPCGMCVVLHM